MQSKSKSNMEVLANHLDHISDEQLHKGASAPPPNAGLAHDTAHAIIHHAAFDYIMGFIIAVNLIVMIIGIDETATEGDDEDKPMHWTEIFGFVVLAIFFVELSMRLLVFRTSFWHDPWNVADAVIVIADLIFTIIGLVAGDVFPVSILRIFRLSKLARVSKVLRIFPELRMLLAGLVHSIRAIFWGTLLLLLFLLVWSMVAVLIIHPLNKEIDYGDSCGRCPRAYSSVMQSALTFWQSLIAGDSWGMATIPLIEAYPATIIFFIPAFASIGLSLMNLMLSVVVNLAQIAYDEEAAKEEAHKALKKVEKEDTIMHLCELMDADKSGELSRAEVWDGFAQPGEFRDSMLEMGFTEDDFDTVWKVIDMDDSGSVSYKEFVQFLFTMKSSAEHFMLQHIQHYVTWLKNAVTDLQRHVGIVEDEEGAILKGLEKIDLQQTGVKANVQGAWVEPTVVNIDEEDADNQPKAYAHVDSSRRPPVANKAREADRGQLRASDASQNLARQISNDMKRMHLELRQAIADMKYTICQSNTALAVEMSNLSSNAKEEEYSL